MEILKKIGETARKIHESRGLTLGNSETTN